jgi:hypothetical protein
MSNEELWRRLSASYAASAKKKAATKGGKK